jgi:hypothetical protein
MTIVPDDFVGEQIHPGQLLAGRRPPSPDSPPSTSRAIERSPGSITPCARHDESQRTPPGLRPRAGLVQFPRYAGEHNSRFADHQPPTAAPPSWPAANGTVSTPSSWEQCELGHACPAQSGQRQRLNGVLIFSPADQTMTFGVGYTTAETSTTTSWLSHLRRR